MTPAPEQLRRRFLPWDRPLLPQAVGALTENWSGEGPLDLADVFVLVPTQQAGRRLREALATHAAERGQAVFPPRVLTLEAYVSETVPVDAAATRLEAQFAWVEVLRVARLDDFRAVFPVNPPERNFAWALRLATELARLQDALAEVGLTFADVPGRVGRQFSEYERWGQLAELARRQTAALAATGLRDASSTRLQGLDEANVPPGIARIIVLATPDPRPVALTLLARHAAQVPVEIWLFAPENEAGAFDAWGRPEPGPWAKRPLLTDNFREQVELCADPEAQAIRTARIAESYAGDDGLLAVGVLDGEIMPLLETALRERGLAAYNPAGQPRRGDRLHQLLAALRDLANDDSFATVSALARHPDVLAALGVDSAAVFLAELDHVQARYLPADLDDARRVRHGSEVFKRIAAWRDQLRREKFPDNVAAVLAEIFQGRCFDSRQPAEAALAESAGAWAEAIGEVTRALERFPQLSASEAWEAALRLYGGSLVFPEKTPGALELQGWLELMWEDAPHLVVAGLNDGLVPSAVNGDPFLPESLREMLGLKTNAMRLATDAYYLHALSVSRARDGRLEVLLGRASASGEPLRPSRLLLHCADVELPSRVEWLFRELPAAGANLAWARAWQLRPREVAVPDRLAVTALRDWLACPFRFYLKRGLKMEAVDPAKAELDAMDFGTLCHSALEAMGNDAAMRDCTDADKLRAFLLDALEAAVAQRFGRELSLPLLVQLESARQRLGFAAETQAMVRKDGWVIERMGEKFVEHKFELPVGAFTLAGKIDRIDRHETTGEIRVLDYKTSDQPVNPAAAHLRGARRDETPPDWAVWPNAGKPRVWCDLQLPVYERVVAGLFPGTRLTCGYFNLPKAVTETGVALWEDYTPELAASAWGCVAGVVNAIARREFWPPRELTGREAEYDDFAPLFQRGAAASVAWPGGAA
ncbi:MAG: PD-(D/E)XK nuclease family protein [Opitutaceae bacterium]|nr:PD-(D/E)XK nuclease family protein [Opitutaceae bacterium]